MDTASGVTLNIIWLAFPWLSVVVCALLMFFLGWYWFSAKSPTGRAWIRAVNYAFDKPGPIPVGFGMFAELFGNFFATVLATVMGLSLRLFGFEPFVAWILTVIVVAGLLKNRSMAESVWSRKSWMVAILEVSYAGFAGLIASLAFLFANLGL